MQFNIFFSFYLNDKLNCVNKNEIFSFLALCLICRPSSWVISPTVCWSSRRARKARLKVSVQRTVDMWTRLFLHTVSRLDLPQMLLRIWSACCRRNTFPRSSPSPNWFRLWAARGVWPASMRWRRWLRASATALACPAWCLSTTKLWHTSRSKIATLHAQQ